jgi:hypothetical protein
MASRARATRRLRAAPKPQARYVLSLYDGEVEQLAEGLCPESVAGRCWEMLKWQREAHRNTARAAAPRRLS